MAAVTASPAIRAAGPWRLAWRRLRRDRVAVTSGVGADLPLLTGIVLFTVAVIVVLNFLLDAFAIALDPTISRRVGGRASLAEGRMT